APSPVNRARDPATTHGPAPARGRGLLTVAARSPVAGWVVTTGRVVPSSAPSRSRTPSPLAAVAAAVGPPMRSVPPAPSVLVVRGRIAAETSPRSPGSGQTTLARGTGDAAAAVRSGTTDGASAVAQVQIGR